MPVTVHVKNFQSIKDATVTVDGLTVITGPNNTGKSALMRAIMGVFTNMDGHAFVRNGETHCEVTLTFEDGQSVTWEKGKSVSRYLINPGTPQEKIIEKMGRGVVPQEVQELGVRFVSVGDGKGSDNKLWPQIARQWMGQVFLLNRSGSVLAEAISDTDRVGRLNRSLRKVESDQRTINSKLKIRRSDKVSVETELKKYEGLDEVVSEVERLGDVEKKLESTVAALRWMESKKTQRDQSFSVIKRLQGVEEIKLPSDNIINEIKGVRTKIRDVYNLSQQHKTASLLIEEYERIDTNISAVLEAENKARKMGTSIKKFRSLKEKHDLILSSLSSIREEVSKKQQDIIQINETIVTLEAERGKCPTCGREVGHGD